MTKGQESTELARLKLKLKLLQSENDPFFWISWTAFALLVILVTFSAVAAYLGAGPLIGSYGAPNTTAEGDTLWNAVARLPMLNILRPVVVSAARGVPLCFVAGSILYAGVVTALRFHRKRSILILLGLARHLVVGGLLGLLSAATIIAFLPRQADVFILPPLGLLAVGAVLAVIFLLAARRASRGTDTTRVTGWTIAFSVLETVVFRALVGQSLRPEMVDWLTIGSSIVLLAFCVWEMRELDGE